MIDTDRKVDTRVDLPWWEINKELIRRTNICISGDPDINWIDYTLSKHLSNRLPMENCLSFGCGRGDVERVFAARNAFIHCDGYEDSGEKEIEIAIEKARLNNLQQINYHIVDMNHLVLPENTYDAAWVNGALHHLKNLEYVFHQINQSLKSNGVFLINEYVGPSRFQFTKEQKKLANSCLQLLPTELRTIQASKLKGITQLPLNKGLDWFFSRLIDKIREGDLLKAIQRRYKVSATRRNEQPLIISEINFPTVSDVIAYDPTLAIRSGDIIPLLMKEFEIIEKKDWGGNILNYLLNDITHNFLNNNPIAQSYLKLLIAIEDTLLDTNRFESDFAYIVARPI